MAATKTDPLAAKQAKQKKILIVLSIVLVAVMAIQLPRIMGGSKGSTSAAPAADAAATTDPAAAGTTPVPATTVAAAQTAPATLAPETAPKAGEAQLASFSLFETKDPFVQQIDEGDGAAIPAAGGSASGGGAKGDGTIAKGGAAGGKQAPEQMTNATISVNGEAQALTVKETFPEESPMFVLASLKQKTARIGIAGGELKNGSTVPLVLGKSLTLVDTATGARYTLRLLYVGSAPEQTAAFTSPSADGGSGDQGQTK